jgi:hypothetical protein
MYFSRQFVGTMSNEMTGKNIQISRIEYDICTGTPKYVPVAVTQIINPGVVPPAAGRIKFDQKWKSLLGDKYTREYLITTDAGVNITKNGIARGQYIQPVTEWTQPETVTPGLAPAPHDFSAFLHLTQGLGFDGTNIWGPLSPFPQSGLDPTTFFDVSKCVVATPSSTTTTTTSTSTTSSAPIPTDTITVVSATWVSKQSGTLTVTCTSSNTNNALVNMVLDLPTGQQGLVMTATSPGTWTFSANKIKQVATVTCRSALGGTKTGPVT